MDELRPWTSMEQELIVQQYIEFLIKAPDEKMARAAIGNGIWLWRLDEEALQCEFLFAPSDAHFDSRWRDFAKHDFSLRVCITGGSSECVDDDLDDMYEDYLEDGSNWETLSAILATRFRAECIARAATDIDLAIDLYLGQRAERMRDQEGQPYE